ncbi:MAG: DUF4190 domain-containing protein [Rothia sp. (in: high G+C Gram-positive bacteria)]|uniref:DUF4190 domain-containing protein n=1 Tax=Rothia sp. (in: high G+C Gram-positive bacteria) TaxID=1885016 RepID=UPI0026DBD830|nr:DUF4190 domain-containing protein [Rothia sp. (in: high G+C Gram-positive bacteria)]MDO4884558.1 DUF4190 domain-containing protein [Rothia sp. (in: high G+C Gram-positive bacteria)]
MSQSPYDKQPENGNPSEPPSYEQLYQNQQPAQPAYQQQPTYQQPMYAQPVMAVVPKTPQQIAGEQAAQTSMTLGVIALVLVLIFFGGPISLILGIFAVKKAGEAERMGALASGGRVMGWISIVVGAIETLFLLIPVVAFIIAIIAAASTSGSSSSRLDLVFALTPLISLL